MQNKHVIGIDIGGMSFKGGIVDSFGKIIYKKTVKYCSDAVNCLTALVDDILVFAKQNDIVIKEVGVGLPCVFDKKTGEVFYGNNLSFNGLNLKTFFNDKYNLSLKMANDATSAALGEYKFGASCGVKNSVLLTIGTGVGCGIILGGKPIESNSSAVGEFGQTVIALNGRKCTCGKKGCFEAYCSMTALIKDAKREMKKNKSSILNSKIDIDNFDGKIFFDCIDIDETAKKIYNRFIKYLSIGILNIANLIRPDMIVIGGGVSSQGEKLIKPLQEFLDKNLFAKDYTDRIVIKTAKNGNDAGILGSASLVL